MECLLGIRFNDFVLLAADSIEVFSIVVMNQEQNKFFPLSDKLIMAVTGEAGDTSQFAEYIEKNIQLYKMRNEYELSPKAAAHFTRRNLAEALRSRSPYNCNMLLAGYDDVEKKASLFFMDYLASMVELPYCAMGYGGHFTHGAMDAYYRPEMTVDEGYELLKKCIAEIAKRLVINLPNFNVRLINKDGISEMNRIQARDLELGS